MKSRDWSLTLSMICTITWPFLLMTTCLDQIRCVLQVDHSKGAISCQLMNSTRCGLFVTFPKIIAFAGRHLVVVFILLKQIFFFLQTVKLSAHNGVEHLSTWQSSIQQSLLTTQTMLDGRLQRASTLY